MAIEINQDLEMCHIARGFYSTGNTSHIIIQNQQ